jgi:hypothetical protein
MQHSKTWGVGLLIVIAIIIGVIYFVLPRFYLYQLTLPLSQTQVYQSPDLSFSYSTRYVQKPPSSDPHTVEFELKHVKGIVPITVHHDDYTQLENAADLYQARLEVEKSSDKKKVSQITLDGEPALEVQHLYSSSEKLMTNTYEIYFPYKKSIYHVIIEKADDTKLFIDTFKFNQ